MAFSLRRFANTSETPNHPVASSLIYRPVIMASGKERITSFRFLIEKE